MKTTASKTDAGCAVVCLTLLGSIAAPARIAAADRNSPPKASTGLRLNLSF